MFDKYGTQNENAWEPIIAEDLLSAVNRRAEKMLEGQTFTRRRDGCKPTTWAADVTECDIDVLTDLINNLVQAEGMGALEQIAVKNLAKFWKAHCHEMACHSLHVDPEVVKGGWGK